MEGSFKKGRKCLYNYFSTLLNEQEVNIEQLGLLYLNNVNRLVRNYGLSNVILEFDKKNYKRTFQKKSRQYFSKLCYQGIPENFLLNSKNLKQSKLLKFPDTIEGQIYQILLDGNESEIANKLELIGTKILSGSENYIIELPKRVNGFNSNLGYTHRFIEYDTILESLKS